MYFPNLYSRTKFYIVEHAMERSLDLSRLHPGQRQDLFNYAQSVLQPLEDELFRVFCPLPQEQLDLTRCKISSGTLLLQHDCSTLKTLILANTTFFGLN